MYFTKNIGSHTTLLANERVLPGHTITASYKDIIVPLKETV